MARVARACGFGIGGLRFRECPRFVPHSTYPANPAQSHKPPKSHKLPDLPNTHKLPILHPVRGRRKASLRDQNPGSEKKRGSDPAKKPASNHPAFRMGLPRYRPQAAPRLAARVPGVSNERPNLPNPKPRAPQSPCLQVPAIPSAGFGDPAEGALRKPQRPSTSLHMGWKSGQGFWRFERSENKQKSVRHAYRTNPTRICSGLLWCAPAWPFFI